jgi:hypothetical protein
MGIAQLNENIPIIEHQNIGSGDTTTRKDIGGPLPFYRRIDTVLCLSDDTVDRDFYLYVNDGTNYQFLGQFTVPAHAGEAGNPLYDIFSHLFPAVQVGLQLPIYNFLAVTAVITVTGDVSFHAIGGAF